MFYFLRLSLSLRKSQVFLYYGYELLQLVSNIRMNWDVKDGSGRKWHFLCSASAIVSVHRSVRGRTRSWRPVRGHTKGQPVTFTVLNGCKSVWLFISVSFLFWRDTCGVPDSSHVIHRHVGIQSWKCSIHRFWIQVHTNMWKSMVFSLRLNCPHFFSALCS